MIAPFLDFLLKKRIKETFWEMYSYFITFSKKLSPLGEEIVRRRLAKGNIYPDSQVVAKEWSKKFWNFEKKNKKFEKKKTWEIYVLHWSGGSAKTLSSLLYIVRLPRGVCKTFKIRIFYQFSRIFYNFYLFCTNKRIPVKKSFRMVFLRISLC